jgi:Arc/MetJ family transcription regulator
MCIEVYSAPEMARTNVDIDKRLVKRVMKLYGLRTIREAVDFALRSVAGEDKKRRDILALRGIGWEGNLEEMRRTRVTEL